MTDKNWTVMNDLQEAFNQITTFSFLLEQPHEQFVFPEEVLPRGNAL